MTVDNAEANSGGPTDLAVTQGELRLLLDNEGTQNERGLETLGLEPLAGEEGIEAYAGLTLRGLARYTDSGVEIVAPIAQARAIMTSSSTSVRIGVAPEAASGTVATFFDGPTGRLAITRADVPGCRILTKLADDEPLADTVARVVRSAAPSEGGVVVALEIRSEESLVEVAVRRQAGCCDTIGPNTGTNTASKAIVDGVIAVLSATV